MSTFTFLLLNLILFSSNFFAAQCQVRSPDGLQLPLFRKSSTNSIKIPLSGGLLHMSGFFINASVGGQHLTLQIDTSYSSLIIPRKGCVGCRTGDHRYDPDASTHATAIPCEDPICAPPNNQCLSETCSSCSQSGHCCVKGTNDCAFNMFYGDGSNGNGTLYRDTVRIGSFDVPMLFGAMHQESTNFELPYTDGVLGMAFQKGACHPACIPPAMDAIVNQTGINNVFTVCVSRYGGTLVLGAADKSLATSDYKYVDLQDGGNRSRFVTPVKPEWRVGGRKLSTPSLTAAVWSTATTHLAFSKSTFLSLLEHLMDHYCHIPDLCSMSSWFRPQTCSAIPEDSVRAMPNITIEVSDEIEITLTPDDYLIKFRKVDGVQERCVAMIATDSLQEKGYGLLFGSTVMRKYATVFDRKNYRIGVAPANSKKCGPLTGSDHGLPGKHGSKGKGPVLTADTPPAAATNQDAEDPDEKLIEEAETCRAQSSCSECSKISNCSYGYQTGRCVPVREATKMPYPFCTGGFCACFLVGGSGWYFGIVIGGILGIAIVLVLVLLFRKRQHRNHYRALEQYEEQDIETF